MLTDMVAMRPAGYFSVENATSNGGDASRVGERCSYYLVEFILHYFLYPDAGRVALSLQQLSGAAANLQTLLNRTL